MSVTVDSISAAEVSLDSYDVITLSSATSSESCSETHVAVPSPPRFRRSTRARAFTSITYRAAVEYGSDPGIVVQRGIRGSLRDKR